MYTIVARQPARLAGFSEVSPRPGTSDGLGWWRWWRGRDHSLPRALTTRPRLATSWATRGNCECINGRANIRSNNARTRSRLGTEITERSVCLSAAIPVTFRVHCGVVGGGGWRREGRFRSSSTAPWPMPGPRGTSSARAEVPVLDAGRGPRQASRAAIVSVAILGMTRPCIWALGQFVPETRRLLRKASSSSSTSVILGLPGSEKLTQVKRTGMSSRLLPS